MKDMKRSFSGQRQFRGGVVDTGAPTSVIGIHEARLYAAELGVRLKLRADPKKRRFRFGVQPSHTLGTMLVTFPVGSHMVQLEVPVVPLDVPLLIGLDVMSRFDIALRPAKRKAYVGNEYSEISLRFDGHLIWPCHPSAMSTFYSKNQLRRLHRHFLHPSAQKLMDLLSRASPADMNEESMRFIREITETCSTCEELQRKPLSFSVRDGENTVFNQRLLIDLMYIDGKPLLHVVDESTNFSAAQFLHSVSAEAVWSAFTKSWSLTYIGHPSSLLVDQGSVFLSDIWQGMCKTSDIQLQATGTESHNSLMAGETLHSPLRRTYRKVMQDHPDTEPDLALALYTKAMNDVTNEDGLCPTFLVLGVIPVVPDITKVPMRLHDRLRAMKTARREYARIVEERRIKRGISNNVPRAADSTIRTGDQVYVWREGPKRFVGPMPLILRSGKHCIVSVNGVPKSFNLAQLKRANTENPFPEDSRYPGSYISEVVHEGDPREANFGPAIHKEIRGLMESGTFRICLEDEIPKDANIIPSRMILSIKNDANGDTIYKARLVMGGHRDRLKKALIHNSSNVSQTSIRLLMALAAVFGFRMWSTDVSQAYLQSSVPILRDIFVKPTASVAAALNLTQGQLLYLLKPCYGISESGDYWAMTRSRFHRNKLNMYGAYSDHALFFRSLSDKLVGVSSSFVDDMLQTGTEEFRQDVMQHLRKQFSITSAEDDFTYAGLHLLTSKEPYSLHQAEYIDRLNLLDTTANFDTFRSYRAQVAWICHSRPDLCVFVARAAQVTADKFTSTDVQELNDAVSNLKRTSDLKLQFPRLDLETLHLVTFSDSSFCNNHDLSTQIGYVVLLCDGAGRCSFLSYRSLKARRVVRSSAAGETIAFSEAFDTAVVLRADLEQVLGKKIPLVMLTDSDSLFCTLTRNRYTREKRLLLDIFAVREAYNQGTIDNIGVIPSAANIADAMTKCKGNTSLFEVIRTGRIPEIVCQWVVERDSRTSGFSETEKEARFDGVLSDVELDLVLSL